MGTARANAIRDGLAIGGRAALLGYHSLLNEIAGMKLKKTVR